MKFDIEYVKLEDLMFKEQWLLPVVVQDVNTKEVLMVAYANKEAVSKTLETGYAHFWSRSRKKLWKKGETSGNFIKVEKILVDCDNDTLLYLAFPTGPTCHTGRVSCFFKELTV
ncbi:MAG: phosphoribosyl-AMP cyclohydrolase [Nitrososphaeria archaeon]|nr:phosphoribosyl-AMP cyclohydrolase [Nitrososphaeria archaeon]